MVRQSAAAKLLVAPLLLSVIRRRVECPRLDLKEVNLVSREVVTFLARCKEGGMGSRGVALGDLRLQAIFDKHPLCIRPTMLAVCAGKFRGRRAARSASVDQPLARALTSARFSTTWTMIDLAGRAAEPFRRMGDQSPSHPTGSATNALRHAQASEFERARVARKSAFLLRTITQHFSLD